MEYPWKMWFKERKGVKVGFSYAFDDNFYLSLTLDKFSSNDERWGMADFRIGKDSWATFKRENLNLNFEDSYESDGREKGDYLRIITTHKDILTVDKREAVDISLEEIKVLKAIDDPIWEELDRKREEYIQIHGERVYDDEDDE